MEEDKSQEATEQVVESTAAAVEADELKIVVTYKSTFGTVGIQRPDCDPVFSRIESDLAEVLTHIPRLIDQARATWETSPKYPKADLPAPPPPPARPAARPASSPAPQSKAQSAFF
jgi:hypothetical protein